MLCGNKSVVSVAQYVAALVLVHRMPPLLSNEYRFFDLSSSSVLAMQGCSLYLPMFVVSVCLSRMQRMSAAWLCFSVRRVPWGHSVQPFPNAFGLLFLMVHTKLVLDRPRDGIWQTVSDVYVVTFGQCRRHGRLSANKARLWLSQCHSADETFVKWLPSYHCTRNHRQ